MLLLHVVLRKWSLRCSGRQQAPKGSAIDDLKHMVISLIFLTVALYGLYESKFLRALLYDRRTWYISYVFNIFSAFSIYCLFRNIPSCICWYIDPLFSFLFLKYIFGCRLFLNLGLIACSIVLFLWVYLDVFCARVKKEKVKYENKKNVTHAILISFVVAGIL